MAKGMIFDIQEFAVHDGPGIRVLVFFKGCPLRCEWCHNPEGLSPKKQLIVTRDRCVGCGICQTVCEHQAAPFALDRCVGCGKCISVCPNGARRLCGREMISEQLAKELLSYQAFLELSGGGITISGGEPLYQAEFLIEVLERLRPLHLAVETSGYAPPSVFREVVERVDLLFLDIKHTNSAIHKRFTGVDNDLILGNLEYLKECGTEFIIRIPLIPGVNDNRTTMDTAADLLSDSQGLLRVEFLPYHKTAGAKYSMVGREYQPSFSTESTPRVIHEPFKTRGIRSVVL